MSAPEAVPRYATPLTPGAVSLGDAVIETADGCGVTLLPWQRHLVRLIGELDDDGLRFRHRQVVVIVPRRAGKTVAVFVSALQRLQTRQHYRAHYTAQTRKDAASLLRDEWGPLLREHHPAEAYTAAWSGSERIEWRPTGSSLAIFSPLVRAIHGADVDLAVIDEAWWIDEQRGSELEAAIFPAMLTRGGGQFLVVSAAGTPRSAWLHHWRDLGRDGTDGIALVEYGADPQVDDLDDPATWARNHPAYGWTVDADTVRMLRARMPPAEFYRAILGVTTEDYGEQPRLDADAWERARSDLSPVRAIAYGLDVAHDGSTASIVAGGTTDDGRQIVVEVIAHEAGTGWVPNVWRQIRDRRPGTLFADSLGPAGAVVDALERARQPVTLVTTSTYAAACQAFVEGVQDGTLRHRGQPVLDAAARTATTRPVGDRWVWNRRGRADAAPIIAATLAAHGARRPATRPYIRVAT